VPVKVLFDVMNEFIEFVASAQGLDCLLVFSTRVKTIVQLCRAALGGEEKMGGKKEM
jgi:hypothetical protein